LVTPTGRGGDGAAAELDDDEGAGDDGGSDKRATDDGAGDEKAGDIGANEAEAGIDGSDPNTEGLGVAGTARPRRPAQGARALAGLLPRAVGQERP
jgi:hypothetical protein